MKNVEIFIDAEYMLLSLRTIYNKPNNVYLKKEDIDWIKFIEFLARDRNVGAINYYTARMDENENIDTYNNQTLYLENLKEVFCDYNFQLRLGKMKKTEVKQKSTWNDNYKSRQKAEPVYTWIQKGIDSKLVLDLCKFAYTADKSNENVAVIVTGDADFSEALQTLNNLGIKTELISFDRRYTRLPNDLKNSAMLSIVLDYIKLHEENIV